MAGGRAQPVAGQGFTTSRPGPGVRAAPAPPSPKQRARQPRTTCCFLLVQSSVSYSAVFVYSWWYGADPYILIAIKDNNKII